MNKYTIDGNCIDSIELKCLIISRGIKVDNAVYRHHAGISRLSKSPLCCNCLLLSDSTIVQLTDTNFHIRHLSSIFNWDNIRLLKYTADLSTPFSLRMKGDDTILYYKDAEIDTINFPTATDFYRQKTSRGLPFVGNTVLQGLDWIAFQCLWACEYAAAGQSCQFCFSGGDFEASAKKGKALPKVIPAPDVAEIVQYAFDNNKVRNVQITGGSTFDGLKKYGHGKAFSNFIIGIEEFSTLSKGATYLAERGILPTASVWIPMGKPVRGSMKAPNVDYYKRVKELFAELYMKYKLEPTQSRGLNVCIEREIWNYANNSLINNQ